MEPYLLPFHRVALLLSPNTLADNVAAAVSNCFQPRRGATGRRVSAHECISASEGFSVSHIFCWTRGVRFSPKGAIKQSPSQQPGCGANGEGWAGALNGRHKAMVEGTGCDSPQGYVALSGLKGKWNAISRPRPLAWALLGRPLGAQFWRLRRRHAVSSRRYGTSSAIWRGGGTEASVIARASSSNGKLVADSRLRTRSFGPWTAFLWTAF